MYSEIGKIKSAEFGSMGYQGVQVGFTIVVGGSGWGTCFSYEGGWGSVSEEELAGETHYKWTHEDRIKGIGTAAWNVFKLMQDAKVDNLQGLVGKPIRAYFDSPNGGNTKLEILKECI